MKHITHSLNILRHAAISMTVGIASQLSPIICHASPEEGVLTVLVFKDSPLMSYRDSRGDLTGFNVDLAHLLCKKIKARCRLEETTLGAVFDQLASGAADFSTSSVTPTPARRQKALFTESTNRCRAFWLGRKRLDQSNHLKVVVVEGSIQYAWAAKESETRQWVLVPVKTNADLSTTLLDGRADATVSPTAATMSMVKDGKVAPAGFNRLDAIDNNQIPCEETRAVSPKKPELLTALNQAILELKSNGQFDELTVRHFPIANVVKSLDL